MKLKFYLTILFGAIFLNSYSQNTQAKKIDSLLIEFQKKSFYGSINPAKEELKKYQQTIIPELIKLLKDTSFVKLTDTADLIYPGTTVFYGHGYFIPYDLDWISVRSGWLLEEVTFQDFGYKNSEINDETLLKLMKGNYNEYIQKGNYEVDWKEKTSDQKKIEYRKILSNNAEKWWKENHKKWNRISAIKEALKSNNENRLSKVFQYLRFGESKCANMTKELYSTEIKPIIVDLEKTNQYPEIQEQIKLLLNESVSLKILDIK
ncbi:MULTISPECIES: hypothetical protein [unclassified Flavobacterium]|uniref:hypothetical protein n=1 Tax=unclassified Flavobacterium TaxID=196869 RepID=UPI0006AB8533|nr:MULTISPECIES: hypothetical protein [unclassified Flavobacterium]KOP35998.1 hypothetical protein AKO67_22235 [Flavobacterium sp. VMW]OWU89681.1 hypothetical protein APR43_15925 [Flavobacterium sp. NLM]